MKTFLKQAGEVIKAVCAVSIVLGVIFVLYYLDHYRFGCS